MSGVRLLLDRVEGALRRGDLEAATELVATSRQSIGDTVAGYAARAATLVERFPDLEPMRPAIESWERHARGALELLAVDDPAAALEQARTLAERLESFEASLIRAERHAARMERA